MIIFVSINSKLLLSVVMFIVISIMLIILIIVLIINNLIIINIMLIENIKIECILIFFWIRNFKNKISNDNVVIILVVLIFLE